MFQRNILFFYSSRTALRRSSLSDVAFIGLGNMGSRMANNLIKKGRNLKVYDISPSASQNVPSAQMCKSPGEAAFNSGIVITMLPDGTSVRNAIFAQDGILNNISKDSLLLDCSTVEPNLAQELYETVKKRGVRFLDAPVSGGIAGAEAGTLTFMVGGDENDVKAVEPILLQMGTKILHCGGPGAGQAAKLCNNLVLAVSMAALSEALNLGTKLGLNPNVLTTVINTSSGRCWSSETYNPVPGILPNAPASNQYNGGFATKLMAKDLALAENAATTCNAPIPLAALANQVYRTMLVHGYALKDFSSVYDFLKGK